MTPAEIATLRDKVARARLALQAAEFATDGERQAARTRAWREAKRLVRRRDLPGPRDCAWCGTEFTPHKNSRVTLRRYCGHACYYAAYWTSKAPGRTAA